MLSAFSCPCPPLLDPPSPSPLSSDRPPLSTTCCRPAPARRPAKVASSFLFLRPPLHRLTCRPAFPLKEPQRHVNGGAICASSAPKSALLERAAAQRRHRPSVGAPAGLLARSGTVCSNAGRVVSVRSADGRIVNPISGRRLWVGGLIHAAAPPQRALLHPILTAHGPHACRKYPRSRVSGSLAPTATSKRPAATCRDLPVTTSPLRVSNSVYSRALTYCTWNIPPICLLTEITIPPFQPYFGSRSLARINALSQTHQQSQPLAAPTNTAILCPCPG